MGIGPFRRSCWTNLTAPAPNPDPSRWELIRMLQYSGAYVLIVRYKDCTNFEGVKVMVFSGQYKYRKKLDPHFSDDGKSPIARFKPTEEGIALAMQFARDYQEVRDA